MSETDPSSDAALRLAATADDADARELVTALYPLVTAARSFRGVEKIIVQSVNCRRN